MKNAIKISITVIVISFVFTALSAIYYTSWEDSKVNNLNIHYSKVTKECVASCFEWDGDAENMTFTVPDEYEGMKVKSLGGAVGMGAPTLFYIMLPDAMYAETTATTEDEACMGTVNEDTVTYEFTVNLGKNIKNLECFSYNEYLMDEDDNVLYIVKINYECSPENKWIYSQNGKLYDKKTNELIE